MLVSPLRIYNTIDKEPMKKRVNVRKHRYAIEKPGGEIDRVELHRLREQVAKYKRGQAKLKRLARWNIRSNKSSLRDGQEILGILEELYGELTYDEENEEY